MEQLTHPEVDIEVAGLLELSVSNLEGDGHSVILVKLLVEALAAVCCELDVVGDGAGEEATQREDGGETHFEYIKATRARLECCWC